MSTPHERLQQARLRAGYQSATAAAEAFNWAVPTYLAHENGTRGIRTDAAHRYATAFGVSWTWLIGGEEENPFAEVVNLLRPIPVKGVIDPGSFRSSKSTVPLPFNELRLDVFGYGSDELEAYFVYGSRDHHFIITSTHTASLIEGDEFVVRRTEGDKSEIAAWRLEGKAGARVLVPAYAPHVIMSPEPLEMLNENASLLGIIVAEYRVKRRVKLP